jgi:hypothetical protein
MAARGTGAAIRIPVVGLLHGRSAADSVPRRIFVAVHESGDGPSRHLAAAQQLGHFWPAGRVGWFGRE